MNTRIKFETAKLLKEKGFDKKVKPFYNALVDNQLVESDIIGWANNLPDWYPAPTIAEVVMWLYEKHGVWIPVDAPHKLLKSWYLKVYKINDEVTLIEESLFNSPTEAYEAAITYVLNNLI